MTPPVIAFVANRDLCIGCGTCAALCPDTVLEMRFSRFGEYIPVETGECTKECGLCLKVCPFSDSGENEDTIGKRLYGEISGIRHRVETGYFLDSYVGHSEKHRLQSASGGVATGLLETLLTEGVVDHVICVAPTGDPERLFAFHIFSNADDVRTGAGSAYYPVEMSTVLRYVTGHPGRYAITGLPCFIKAIRLAQQRNRTLRERILVTVGLVCGQLKSKHFTEYIAALAGVKGRVTAVRYRGKSPDQPASNFYFSFLSQEGDEKKIFRRDGISEAWTNRWFTPNACNYCDDVFAECADIVCMDAWLPEYSGDSRGTSLIVVRSPVIREILMKGVSLSLKPIPIDRVIQSQSGILAIKRHQLSYRLYHDSQSGIRVPKKRIPAVIMHNVFTRQHMNLKEKMRLTTRDAWIVRGGDVQYLRNKVQKDLKRLEFMNQFSRIIFYPVHIIRFLIRKRGAISNG
ncbi:MAG TPA: Coenzyme F420 hydrogenase/dehydrogenase, beta subunit C-terminal domain [Atribacter sp.]|uniref:Coenzyme F420 hydrogenase/dehydrogenase, beta subunit C-terminal domain n=1 Tax=Atribacter sp. TaxID=2847780 RepID=UPI002C1891CD|nr:Coenzyme F420 hydrogenase/dehydrogenase, beta subunit C-terminal domain [Atribacter sp.]HQK83550.1 Coenzyme F420 hydrogenase/dehydrogenase, beta subunit C-terminal domain [Atribacter sp.]